MFIFFPSLRHSLNPSPRDAVLVLLLLVTVGVCVEQYPLYAQLDIVEGGEADAGGEGSLDKVHAEPLVEAPPQALRPATQRGRVKLGTGQ